MLRARSLLAAGVLAALGVAAPGTASAFPQEFLIDPGFYEGPDSDANPPFSTGYNGITHGSIIDAEFHDLIAGQLDVDVSASNESGTASRHAVAFDSHVSGTEDTDLEDQFINPGTGQVYAPGDGSGEHYDASGSQARKQLNLERPGHVFIVQERDSPSSEGCDGLSPGDVCGHPDDDGAGGRLWFDFSMPVTLTSAALFDIDGMVGDPQWSHETAELKFFGAGSSLIASETVAGFDVGNRGAIRRAFNGGAGYDGVVKLEVIFSGSGAIDQIAGFKDIPQPPTAVPEPATLGLLGAGVALLGLSRRRRRRRG